ncbi:uncharacterized protein RCC_03540 [Ramularia collo-cygni]|uniref:Uncharacterized protein n=1 Tax=Ramularia collo-cygni TaxID=112498 RepID=A0A2D3VB54_9PEZI|nr:uncharacterized protein RCC_03540 [Ramularia collo-cygni]CZT17703.1 uncharacterized protein RCC_03540 [Ramularia collo-cygni]
MRVAEFLSDMTTLSICDAEAALALVSARPPKPDATMGAEGSTAAASDDNNDQDLNRAKDLLNLHGTVKVAHQDGIDKELQHAREAVAKVLRDL